MSRKTKGKYGGVRRNIKSISLKKNHKKRHAISKVKPASLSALKRGTNRNLQYRYEAQRAIGGRGGNKILTGGNMTTPVNGPVGYSWDGGNVSTWPGVQGSGGAVTNGVTMSNHFSLSPNGIVVGGIDPAISTSDDQLINSSMNGGKRRKNTKRRQNNKIYKSRKYKHGQTGGFFQEIVNLGREAQSGVNSGYFSLIGKQQPISQNPYPTEGQYSSISNQNHLTIDPPNLRAIYTDANNTVAKI
jgi:hypothetical protein